MNDKPYCPPWREAAAVSGPGIAFVSSDIAYYRRAELFAQRGLSNTFCEQLALNVGRNEISSFIINNFGKDGEVSICHLSRSQMIVLDLSTISWIELEMFADYADCTIYGNSSEIAALKKKFLYGFETTELNIKWIYSAQGESISIQMRSDHTPVTEMYPFLNGESLQDYYERFINSDATIMVLLGPPGTGKTSFIRGLIQMFNLKATITYDSLLLERDYVFAEFMESESSVMVMEDADTLLQARSSGNTIMHKFLNVGDGLVTAIKKKMIFSTNLPNISDIDSALIRPGRCFDVLHFNPLTYAEAKVLADKVGATLAGNKDKYTVAEVFSGRFAKSERGMGFV